MKRPQKYLLVTLSILIPSLAFGNVVWPAMYTETKVSSIPIIALSLIIEFFVFKYLFQKSTKLTSVYTIIANVASGLIGLFIRPISGLLWEVSLGALVMWIFDWGTFNPVAWFFVPIIGGAINSALELFTVKVIWKERFTKRNFLLLWSVNWATVGIATLWVVIYPQQL
tara:strand:+ start:59 stop:565 length:507 start_codon:yes stop_codon:yes gene_type:complete